MKIKNDATKREFGFDEYKKIIDEMISNKKIDKLKFKEDYFDICGNYWVVDRYIASDGVFDESMTPNTLSTYKKALEQGYAISIPVQMLDDESIVCFSYQNISHAVPGKSGYLKKLTLNEVKEIKLNGENETIPTLDEALGVIAGSTPIIIEIINDGMVEKFENKVISLLNDYINKFDCYEKVAVMSVNPYTLQYFFNNYPYVTRILKSGNFKDKYFGSIKTSKLKKLKYYKLTHADIIAYSSELLPSVAVEKKKPIVVLAHTVTSQNAYIALAEHCDNIIFKNFKPVI